MTAERTVSAVIPVYNGEAYVSEAIQSVLDQTRAPIECIVIDDGSTDDTPSVVAGFGDAVIHVRQPQRGVSAARNHGTRIASGKLVGFLDHDDAWLPRKLELQVAALAEREATMALCATEIVDAGGATLGTKRLRARSDLITGMLMFDGTETVSCSSTGLIWRARLLEMGGFDPSLSMSADWDLLMRTLLAGDIAYVDEPLVRYRVHANNMSRRIDVMEHDMTRAFAKTFADPRLPPSLKLRQERAYGRLYRMLAGSYRDSREHTQAIRALIRAVRRDPRLVADLIRSPPGRPDHLSRGRSRNASPP